MSNTIMESEAKQSPDVIEHQISCNDVLVRNIAAQLVSLAPKMVMIIGRGSSDHAGVFAKYLIEIELNIPTFSAAPSISGLYKKQLKLESAVVIVISQSGRSPDIIEQAKMAKLGGAYCVAIVNDETSPLKDIVDQVLPIRAGTEVSVAATKSYLATLSALMHLISVWSKNTELYSSLKQLPIAMRNVIANERQLRYSDFQDVKNIIVLSRGITIGIAKEIALKLKEVCCIHAEAFSSAEFLHGPITLLEKGIHVLNCAVEDECKESHAQQIDEIIKRKGHIILLDQAGFRIHPRLAPFLILQRFYIDIAKVSVLLNLNPDKPLGLKKVTQTL